MTKPIPLNDPKDVYLGKIIAVRRQLMKEPTREIQYEWAYRSPGTRALIVRDNQILITKEFRPAQNSYDFRLPGGKVFDTLEEYRLALEKDNDFIINKAHERVEIEALEEAGIVVKGSKLIHISKCGATMRWDLYYFLIEDFETHPKGQHLDHGEIITPIWKSFDEVKKMCLDGSIKEDRTVAVLLRFLLK